MATTKVRDYLKSKGFKDGDIGFDNSSKTVTLRGQNFYTPGTIQEGRSLGTRETLDKALSAYQNQHNPPSSQGSVVDQQNPQSSPQPNMTSDIQSLLANLTAQREAINNRPAFNYVPESDPAYLAALRTANMNATQASNQNLADMNRRGILNSTVTSDRGARIQQEAVGRVTNEALPQLLAQAYQRYRDEGAAQQAGFNNTISQIGTLSGLQQQQFNQDQQDWMNRFTYGQAIGQFGNGQMTVQNRNALAELTGFLPDGTPTNAQQQQQLENAWAVIDQLGEVPAQLAEIVGLPAGTRTQQAIQQAIQNRISSQNAGTASTNAQTGAQNAEFNRLMRLWEATGIAPNGMKQFDVEPGTPFPQPEPEPAKPVPYQNNPDYADDFQNALNNPQTALRTLRLQAAAFIKEYGVQGYNGLVEVATRELERQAETE